MWLQPPFFVIPVSHLGHFLIPNLSKFKASLSFHSSQVYLSSIIVYELLIQLLIHYYYLSQMAHVEVSKLSGQELAELACTYAALLLHDDQQDITGEKISKLVNTAGVKIEPYWPKLFAKALQGQDITSFFNYGGSSSSAPAASEPAKPAPVVQKKAEEKGGKKQQKKKEAPPPPPEEEDVDMGDLFG